MVVVLVSNALVVNSFVVVVRISVSEVATTDEGFCEVVVLVEVSGISDVVSGLLEANCVGISMPAVVTISCIVLCFLLAVDCFIDVRLSVVTTVSVVVIFSGFLLCPLGVVSFIPGIGDPLVVSISWSVVTKESSVV